MIEKLYDVDLAFIVDTTGSMGSFLDAARRQMVDALKALSSAPERPLNLRVGLVEYRDHPPQDTSFVARSHGFKSDLKQVQKVITGLEAEGGGDTPEAVFDGLLAAGEELKWRPHACRLAMLIGDAPPHGVGCAGDHFRGGCPCGLTAESTTAVLESRGLTLYAGGRAYACGRTEFRTTRGLDRWWIFPRKSSEAVHRRHCRSGQARVERDRFRQSSVAALSKQHRLEHRRIGNETFGKSKPDRGKPEPTWPTRVFQPERRNGRRNNENRRTETERPTETNHPIAGAKMVRIG